MLASFLSNSLARLYLPQIFVKAIIWFAGTLSQQGEQCHFFAGIVQANMASYTGMPPEAERSGIGRNRRAGTRLRHADL